MPLSLERNLAVESASRPVAPRWADSPLDRQLAGPTTRWAENPFSVLPWSAENPFSATANAVGQPIRRSAATKHSDSAPWYSCATGRHGVRTENAARAVVGRDDSRPGPSLSVPSPTRRRRPCCRCARSLLTWHVAGAWRGLSDERDTRRRTRGEFRPAR